MADMGADCRLRSENGRGLIERRKTMKKTIQEIVCTIDLIDRVIEELDHRDADVDGNARDLLEDYRDMLMRRVVDI